MKSNILLVLATIALSLPALAADMAGPNGGRILKAAETPVEFLVTADRKVQITFLGSDGKAVVPGEQRVVVTAGDRQAPTRLAFVKSGDVLISEQALPAGTAIPAVVQIKAQPEAAMVVEKFTINMAECPGCRLREYACICAH